MKLDDGSRTTILVHYYRAMVGRADSWRMRMDTTTHWAIVTTAAVLSLALGDPASPHAVVPIASFLTLIFLLLEARRLTFYHLWQNRVLILERALVAPAVSPTADAPPLAELEAQLGPQLGTTAPTMSLMKAAARRLRRVYVYLFAAQGLAWIVKLSTQPTSAKGLGDVLARARIGLLPGELTLGLAIGLFGGAIFVAVARGATTRRDRTPD